MAVLICLTATLVAVTLLVSSYLRRGAGSLQMAAMSWDEFHKDVTKILQDESYPVVIRNMVFWLANSAGCGCYVRSMLITHYVPGVHKKMITKAQNMPGHNALARAMTSISNDQRHALNLLFVHLIVFDGFANPLQGWIFRRLIRSYKQAVREQKIPRNYAREAKAATLNVVTNTPDRMLCAA